MSEGNVAADQLRLFIERIERLEEEKKGIGDDIKDVYLRQRPMDMTARSCVRSSACGRCSRMTGRKWRLSSRPTSPRWGWSNFSPGPVRTGTSACDIAGSGRAR